jgi:hypothetical protein
VTVPESVEACILIFHQRVMSINMRPIAEVVRSTVSRFAGALLNCRIKNPRMLDVMPKRNGPMRCERILTSISENFPRLTPTTIYSIGPMLRKRVAIAAKKNAEGCCSCNATKKMPGIETVMGEKMVDI